MSGHSFGAYLAGPINGLTDKQVAERRKEWRSLLPVQCHCHFPEPIIERTGAVSARSTFSHDVWAIRRADVLLADLRLMDPEAGVTCYGSIAEIGIGASIGKLVVVVIEEDNPMMHHPFVGGAADVLVHTAVEAAKFLRNLT